MRRNYLMLVVLLLALPTPLAGQLRPHIPQLSVAAQDTSEYAQQRGWFTRDKGLHFGISAVGAGGVYALGRELGLGRWASVAASALVMGSIGLAREVVDRDDHVNYVSRRFISGRDLVWDGVGVVVGISVTDLLFRRRWESRGSAR